MGTSGRKYIDYARVALFILTIYILSEFHGWDKVFAALGLFILIVVLRKIMPKDSKSEIEKNIE